MHMKLDRQKAKAGFTMTEMIVVAGIMAVVSGVMFFNVARRSPDMRVEQAQFQMLADLRKARMDAVGKNAPANVYFNTSAKTYTIWVDRNRNGAWDNGEYKVKSIPNSRGVSMYTYPSNGRFNPNGTFTSSYYYNYIYFYSGSSWRYVYVFPNGQVDPWG